MKFTEGATAAKTDIAPDAWKGAHPTNGKARIPGHGLVVDALKAKLAQVLFTSDRSECEDLDRRINRAGVDHRTRRYLRVIWLEAVIQ